MKNKLLALKLLKQKIHDPSLTFSLISEKTGYSKRQLIRLSHSLDGLTDMEALCHHANEGKEPFNKALESEIQFLIDLKKPYPSITISQFRDIFFEDVLNDPAKSDVVARYQLRPRSLSWFRSLFIQQGRKSPVSRKPLRRDGRAPHPLREPAPQRGMLIQIDGTPFDWIGNNEMWTLHLAVDDATTEPLAGCFMPTKRQLGYCYVMYDTLTKYGIPMSLYSDKYTIFRSSKEGSLTQFG